MDALNKGVIVDERAPGEPEPVPKDKEKEKKEKEKKEKEKGPKIKMLPLFYRCETE